MVTPASAKTLTSPRAKLLLSASKEAFAGSYQNNGTPTNVVMTINYPQLQDEQKFLNIIMPKVTVAITLNFPGPLATSISFPAGYLDESTNVLRAETSASDPSNATTYLLSLTCNRVLASGVTLSWNCIFTDGNRIANTLVLTPTAVQ